ncbi:SRPBCC family protein [Agaribacter marinus]|uniref:Polyketide cyclase / dehydrase and lipid transport n=1 Tax=Agaribacter marinus TaxID=1431249 RepID=A0AA37WJV8_9ALTE|nr:SRPBCC family protein [Agaribacter marinus]GLR72692.1 hypothetical protein GCM10007852_36000 [Agaribacter marinus]
MQKATSIKLVVLTLTTIITTASIAKLSDKQINSENSGRSHLVSDNYKVSVRKQINAPAENVWAIVGALDGMEKFMAAYVKHSQIDGLHVGAQRIMVGHNGKTQYEKIETYRPEARTYSYSVEDKANYPLKNLRNHVRVEVLSDNMSMLVWTSTYDEKASHPHPAILQIRMNEMLDTMVTGVKKIVESGSPP